MVTEERPSEVKRDELISIHVKIRSKMLARVRNLAERDGTSTPDVIRRAVSRLLREEDL